MKYVIDSMEIQRRYRRKGDCTDTQFCQNCGINRNSYKNLKRGVFSPTLENVMKISVYLECSVNDIIKQGD